MKPGDFFIGVLDFFAILLPGSFATWLIMQYIPARVLIDALTFGVGESEGTHQFVIGAAFFLSSYMLGHFVFMAGSSLDKSYDRWRKRTKPTNRDNTFKSARRLQMRLNGEIVDGEFTTLKWAKAYLQAQAPQARSEVDRLEADSKFFRSLVIVWTAFAAHFLLALQAPLAGAAAILLVVLSYRRYRDQRWKMTELSYGTAVIVDATKAVAKVAASEDKEPK